MEYRFLLLSVLVTMAYAKINKWPEIFAVDTCGSYEEKLGNMMNLKYVECQERNADGENLCCRFNVLCDSIADCPNSQDERRPDCPSKHREYCLNGFKGKGEGVVVHNCTQAEWQEPDDIICYGDMDVCDGRRHCPLGDDEMNCPP